MRTYVVQPGDSPAQIAVRFAGCPKCARDLVMVNRSKPTIIYPNGYETFTTLRIGEKLALPDKWFDGSLDKMPESYFASLPSVDGGRSTLGPRGLSGPPRTFGLGATGPIITTDSSGDYVLDTSGVQPTPGSVSQLQSIGNNPGAWLSSQRIQLANAILSTIPIVGWIVQGIIATVGWASGGGGLCGDGQPHIGDSSWGSWESNLGSYPTPINLPPFEAAAYAVVRQDYDTGLQCQYAGAPPVPLGEVFGQLLAAYNKANASNLPTVTHSRQFKVYEGSFGGKSIGVRGLQALVPDPVSMSLIDLWSAAHPTKDASGHTAYGLPDSDTTSPPVGAIVTISYTANDRPGAPAGGTTASSTASKIVTGTVVAGVAGAAGIGVYAWLTKQTFGSAAKNVYRKIRGKR